MSFNDGYTEELSRRQPEPQQRRMSVGTMISFIAAIPAAWLFYGYVAQPVWNLGQDIVVMTRQDQANRLVLEPMVDGCFDNGLGAVGIVMSVETGSTVKIAFASGIVQVYKASSLRPVACPVSK